MSLDRVRIRERGHPSESLGLRCPTELVAAAKALERDKSKGAIRLMDIANDARTVLGDDWVRVELYANEHKVTEGEALGRLAAEALKRGGRR